MPKAFVPGLAVNLTEEAERRLSLPPPTPVVNFQATDGEYGYTVLPPGIRFQLGRVRREKADLCGELTVFCDLGGGNRTSSGALLTADFNLSSARARAERAKLLSERSHTKPGEVDWLGYLEEFCERVFEAERRGAPALRLDLIESPGVSDDVVIDGVTLLEHHPVILFGDGGVGKSYLALYFAGVLTARGHRVLYADWELAPYEHRQRYDRLFSPTKPHIWYLSCDQPLVREQERLQRIIREERISYLIVDSAAVACEGPPESSEVATAYYRAVRRLRVGSLHLAHISGAEDGDKRPFGSRFWANLARGTWFVKRDETSAGSRLTVGVFHRKANLGPLSPAVAFTLTFEAGRTSVTSNSVTDEGGALAAELPLHHRLLRSETLRIGPATLAFLAEELGAPETSIRKTAKRHSKLFRTVLGADGVLRVALSSRKDES